ncbi:hypothetical protein FOZ60_007793 [Perkinsus olseni]|uniref:Uncharacterized protein n=1 Tax=Perkinsus olseni TaxID=32597 RepID=A0A7J6PED4_PEROL|nr:hypothetical protein FOZ60_007793 [Perkinsus olseni]
MVNLCASSVIATLLLMTTAAGQTVGKFRRRGLLKGIGYSLVAEIVKDLPIDDSKGGRVRFTFEAPGFGEVVSNETRFDPTIVPNYYDVDFDEALRFAVSVQNLLPQDDDDDDVRYPYLFTLVFTPADLRSMAVAPLRDNLFFWKEDSPLRSGTYHRYDPNYGLLNATLTINVTDVFINVLVGNDDVIYVSIANVNGERKLVPFGRVGPTQTSTTPVPMGNENLVI